MPKHTTTIQASTQRGAPKSDSSLSIALLAAKYGSIAIARTSSPSNGETGLPSSSRTGLLRRGRRVRLDPAAPQPQHA